MDCCSVNWISVRLFNSGKSMKLSTESIRDIWKCDVPHLFISENSFEIINSLEYFCFWYCPPKEFHWQETEMTSVHSVGGCKVMTVFLYENCFKTMHLNCYYMFWRRGNIQTVQVLFCHTPEERMSTFRRAATASALNINSELLSAFAEGEDPLSKLWGCWCWQCLCCTHFME